MTILHGLSEQIVPTLGTFDLVLTDPPYAPGGARKEWKVSSSTAIALHAAAKAVKDKGTMIVLSASSGRGQGFVCGAVESVLPLNRTLVWHKEFVRSRAAGPWRWDIVLILIFGRGSWGRPERSSCFRSSGCPSKASLGETGHPAEVPDGLAEWLVGAFDPGPIRVLDPFCGSGSLLLPAVRRGWDAVGIDREEKWADIARTRKA